MYPTLKPRSRISSASPTTRLLFPEYLSDEITSMAAKLYYTPKCHSDIHEGAAIARIVDHEWIDVHFAQITVILGQTRDSQQNVLDRIDVHRLFAANTFK